MLIPTTTQLELLTWRPPQRPRYDEAVFIRRVRGGRPRLRLARLLD